MEITKEEFAKHCADATTDFIDKMEDLDEKGKIALLLSIIAFTSTLTKRMFSGEE